jgi:hypothetical protein
MRSYFRHFRLAAVPALALLVAAAPAQAGLHAVASPNVANSNFDQLDGTAQVSPTSAWAVGFERVNGTSLAFHTLIEHWNGTAWSIQPGASLPAADDTRLHAITAVSPADIWAVGSVFTPAGQQQSLIEHWDGAHWSIVPSPAAEPGGSELLAISAASATDIWAVGDTNPSSSGFSTLTEHWNGTAWSVVPGAPITSTGHDFLTGVAAVAANDVWAVGRTERHSFPIIEHWDGTGWAQVAQPVSGFDSALNAITAVAANDIWAVGEQNLSQTVTEHWNGTAWTLVPSPSVTVNNGQDTLSAVAAASPTDVWAVGQVLENFSSQVALALHWNGTAWQVVHSAVRNSGSFLHGVTVSQPGQPLWAVGGRTRGTSPFTATLIETAAG